MLYIAFLVCTVHVMLHCLYGVINDDDDNRPVSTQTWAAHLLQCLLTQPSNL